MGRWGASWSVLERFWFDGADRWKEFLRRFLLLWNDLLVNLLRFQGLPSPRGCFLREPPMWSHLCFGSRCSSRYAAAAVRKASVRRSWKRMMPFEPRVTMAMAARLRHHD